MKIVLLNELDPSAMNATSGKGEKEKLQEIFPLFEGINEEGTFEDADEYVKKTVEILLPLVRCKSIQKCHGVLKQMHGISKKPLRKLCRIFQKSPG